MTDVQKKLLSIYKSIKYICEKHNITFYADGGTKLGAVRHQGFIPWDDDMDLAMPLDDYEKFIKIAESDLDPRFKLLNGRDLKHVDYSFVRIVDTESTFIHWEDFSFTESYGGVAVDIFPYIGIDSNKVESTDNKELDIITDKLTDAKIYDSGDSVEELLKRQQGLFNKHQFNTSPYIRNGTTSMYKYRAIFNNSWKDKKQVWLKFEDTEVPVSPEYKHELTCQYGDYMQMPPEEERISHHGGIVDTSIGFNEFKKSISESHLTTVRDYVHKMQTDLTKLNQTYHRLLDDFETELKHKDYFISEENRKYNEERAARESIEAKYNLVVNSKWWKLRKAINKIIGRK